MNGRAVGLCQESLLLNFSGADIYRCWPEVLKLRSFEDSVTKEGTCRVKPR